MTCEHYDCGWCFYPTVHEEDGTNFFGCSGVDKCPFIEFPKEEEGDE